MSCIEQDKTRHVLKRGTGTLIKKGFLSYLDIIQRGLQCVLGAMCAVLEMINTHML